MEQEQEKILVTAKWLCQCLFEFILTLERNDGHYRVMLSIVTLRKCLEANLWENSKLVIKQVGEIGWKEADTLAVAGLNSWDKVADHEHVRNFSGRSETKVKVYFSYLLDLDRNPIIFHQ